MPIAAHRVGQGRHHRGENQHLVGARRQLDGDELAGSSRIEMRVRPDGRTYGVTLDGLSPIDSQTYDRAELIRLRILDESGGMKFKTVEAGAATQVWAATAAPRTMTGTKTNW